MKKYTNLWKNLINELSIKSVLDGLFGSFIYTTLLAIPALLVMAQLISVYFYLLTLWVVLIIIVVILLNLILHHWWKKALEMKNKEITTDIKSLFLINQIIIDIFCIIIGLLFIFVFIPMMLV